MRSFILSSLIDFILDSMEEKICRVMQPRLDLNMYIGRKFNCMSFDSDYGSLSYYDGTLIDPSLEYSDPTGKIVFTCKRFGKDIIRGEYIDSIDSISWKY